MAFACMVIIILVNNILLLTFSKFLGICIHRLHGIRPASFDDFRAGPMIHQPKYSPGVSGITVQLSLLETKSPQLVHKHMVKSSPRKYISSQLTTDYDPVDASIVVPLSRIADSPSNSEVLARLHKWPLSARCAISGQRVHWKPGFAPGLGWYHIVGQNTPAIINQGSSQIMDRNALFKPGHDDIMMLSHIYDFWKAGLLAIHPDTLRVRCFVPSDLIRDYDDKAASFPDSGIPDLAALRIHYEICVWVNMTAFLPRIPLTLSSVTNKESMFHELVEPSIKKMQALHTDGVGATCDVNSPVLKNVFEDCCMANFWTEHALITPGMP